MLLWGTAVRSSNPTTPAGWKIPGIGVTYLTEGAYGVFGSTTIAYGPSEGNGQADYICQYASCAPCGTAHRSDGRRWKPEPVRVAIVAPGSRRPENARTVLFTRRSVHSAGAGRRLTRCRDRACFNAYSMAAANLPALGRSGGKGPPAREKSVADPGSRGGDQGTSAAGRETGSCGNSLGIRSEGMDDLGVQGSAKHHRTSNEISERRIYALTGSIGGSFSEGGRVVSIIATTEAGEIVHLRRVHSR